MRFPYRRYPAPQGQPASPWSSQPKPLVRLQLSSGPYKFSVWALCDTGADRSFFPLSVAQAMGLDLSAAQTSTFQGTSGHSQVAYEATVLATLWNGDLSCPATKWELHAGFSQSLEHIGFGMLGTIGFFDRFPVMFNYPAGYFEIG